MSKRNSCKFIFYIVIVGCIFLSGALFFVVQNYVVDFSVLAHYDSIQPSVLLDDVGDEWFRFQRDRRELVEGCSLPQHVINAFIAAEDWDFFFHKGISWKGIIRSIMVNIYAGRKAQGASTITQQLVKLLFFDSQKTFTRKIKEQFYALLIEQQFTKEQILTTYLNHVCFGCGIYGIEAASQRFWAKHAHELSIGQAATLAGIICSPARYCPLMYPLSAEKRRNIVLLKMKNLGFISPENYTNELTISVDIQERVIDLYAPHCKEMMRMFLEDEFGRIMLYSGGLSIQTTLNKQMQLAAQEAFNTEMIRLRKDFGEEIDGGMVVIDRKTGEIKALVGGVDFNQSKFNRVKARRQMGSIFKPLIYAAAVESGMNFTQTDIDEPLEIIQDGNSWKPRNYNKKFNGQITLAYALSHSNNIVAIKTLLQVGAVNIINLAKKCHIKGPFHSYPSLALGCIDGTLLEAVGMFNVFANDGIYVEPHMISWVKNKIGSRIYKFTSRSERVLQSYHVGQIASVLCLGPNRVKKMYSAKNWITSEAMSKTGTTNDSRTCWYVGSTPSLTVAIYVGFDDNRPMGEDVYPIRTAFPIWLRFNKAIESSEKKFVYDPFLREITINEFTGQPCASGMPNAITILV